MLVKKINVHTKHTLTSGHNFRAKIVLIIMKMLQYVVIFRLALSVNLCQFWLCS